MVRIWLACRQWICVDGERCRCCLGGCRSRQCCCYCGTLAVVAVPELAVTVEEDGGGCCFSLARLQNTMAPVHLEPRHKRNFMASGNDRGQKGCL